MKNILSPLLLASLLALSAAGAPAPSVDAILEKHVAARGGRKAIESTTSCLLKGKVESTLLPTPSEWEMWSKAPAKQWSQFEIPGMGPNTDGYDGMVAWSKSPFGGLRSKTGEELAKAKRDADFHRDLKFKTLYPGLAYKGIEKVDNEEAYVLETKLAGASKERLSFSVKSGLLIRQESELDGGQGLVRTTVRPGEYREVQGVKYPHVTKGVVEVNGQQMDFTIRVSEVLPNAKMDDAKFVKPAQ
jgi:hypothetical protein